MIYPKIDIIIPPGRHSWNFSNGWINTIKKKDCLGLTIDFNNIKTNDPFYDIKNSKSDLILLLGGDHHLDFLHNTPSLQEFWRKIGKPRICYCYESIKHSVFNDSMAKTHSAMKAFSHFVYNDELDKNIFETMNVPNLWLNQPVDHLFFNPPEGEISRVNKIFFRGKVDKNLFYEKRLNILNKLIDKKIIDFIPNEISDMELARQYRIHKIAINLPNNFGGFNVRAFEALASGCILIQNKFENRPQTMRLLKDRENVIFYDENNINELINLVDDIINNPSRYSSIAMNGYKECVNSFTIEKQLEIITDFVEKSYIGVNKLHIGCGTNLLTGFTNIDQNKSNCYIISDNAEKINSSPNSSCDLIYACHILEHFPRHKTVEVLKNWLFKLKPGGKIYISVPNFRYLIDQYLKNSQIMSILPPLMGGQDYEGNFHYNAFDENYIVECLNAAGFVGIDFFNSCDYEFTSNDCSRWDLSLNCFAIRPLDGGAVSGNTNECVINSFDPIAATVHFFTIVLNGEPFIRHHIEVFKQLPFDWHWHIVEGVADLKHDTAWSLAQGGHISGDFHRQGRSMDGTSEYLDELAAAYPERVTIYRKPLGQLWDGKLEMVNAPLGEIPQGALLWQVDADELWTVEQILQMREMFEAEPDRKAAYFWCHFFMGPDWVISTRGTYGNHREYEWLRVYRFELGARWSTHEPPVLVDRLGRPLAEQHPFLHRETERAGLVFQHMAYTLESQVHFKESYYGYTGAVAAWKHFQSGDTATMLALHFPWVNDHARAQRIETLDVHPLASQDGEGRWSFESHGLSPCQEQILYIRTDAIGDAILSNSILPHLRERWPQALITVLCQDRVADLYQACPWVNEVLSFDRGRAVSDEGYRNSLLAQVRTIGADRTLCPVFSREVLTDLLVGASQAPVRIGMVGDLSNQSAEDKAKTDPLYTRLIPSREGAASELDHHQDFLSGLGINTRELEPTIWTTAIDEMYASNFFDQEGLTGSSVLAFFPGAQQRARVYDRYRPVLENLAAEGWRILAYGSESEIALCDGFISGLPGAINLAGQLGLGKVAAMFRRCSLGLGAESGLAHLSCAVGLPNVVVLGGGHFGRFCPSSPKTTAAVLPLDCYFCNWQCRFEHPHCVKDLAPEVLMRAVELARQPSERPRIVAQDQLLSHKGSLPSVIDLGPLLNSGNVEYHLVPVEGTGAELVPEKYEGKFQGSTLAASRTTVICAVWHKDPDRFDLLRGHQASLDAQIVPIDRIYVFDGGDRPPEWLKGRCISLNEPLGLYEAWNAALALVRTPYVMNLNLDDRLNPEAVAVFQQVLDDGADLVGGDWLICFSQAETDATGPSVESSAIPFYPEWPPRTNRVTRLGSGTGERGTFGPACAWRMSLHGAIPRYPWRFGDGSPIRIIGDAVWWSLLKQQGKILKRVPALIGRYHSHPEGQAEFRNPAEGEHEKLVRLGLASL